MLGFWSCETGIVTDWILDISSGNRKRQADFTSKQRIFHSSCKPARESIFSVNLDHSTKAFGLLQLNKKQIGNVCG